MNESDTVPIAPIDPVDEIIAADARDGGIVKYGTPDLYQPLHNGAYGGVRNLSQQALADLGLIAQDAVQENPDSMWAEFDAAVGGINYDARSETLHAERSDLDVIKKRAEEEANYFNLDLGNEKDRYLEAHNSLLSKINEGLQENFALIKDTVIDKTARRLAKDDSQKYAELKKLMAQRGDALTLGVEDGFDTSFNAKWEELDGYYDDEKHAAIASHWPAVRVMIDGGTEKDAITHLSETTVAHEIMHGIFMNVVSEVPDQFRTGLRNGVETGIGGTKWVNEGLIEDHRRTIMELEPSDVAYEPYVMALNMLEGISPGIKDMLLEAAILNDGPGPVYGMIELIVGPTGIEDIQTAANELLHDNSEAEQSLEKYFEYLDKFKERVAAMLAPDNRERGMTLLNEQEELIFKHLKNKSTKVTDSSPN